jgi:hypothetical protein
MDIYILFAQRKERYAGEYAPEALAVLDEAGHDENPAYLAEELKKAEASGDFSSAKIFRIELPPASGKFIHKTLNEVPSVRGSFPTVE